MSIEFPQSTDNWILQKDDRSNIVVSSRARLARNLKGFPYSPRASAEQLAEIADRIRKAVESSEHFKNYRRYVMSEIPAMDRRFLKESHLISAELEKGEAHREVYLNTEADSSIMVNEEDHLRIQTMLSGFRVREIRARIETMESELERVLEFSYAPQFGYLTACPTNTGTGLRVSVMLHLVGLVMANQIEEALGALGNFGLVVRGAYGEHSNHAGDLFQVSNEVTLGKSEEELVEVLERLVKQLIEREERAREMLFKHAEIKCEDVILRAVGILSYAQTMESNEAVSLLSRVRLGLDRKLGFGLSHEELNRMIIDVQPAHLRRSANLEEDATDEGDRVRAAFLRERFRGIANGRGESAN